MGLCPRVLERDFMEWECNDIGPVAIMERECVPINE